MSMICRLNFILLFFVLIPIVASAKKHLLTDKSSVSIMTCGKTSKYLYALFGHSAIRVKDPLQNLDIVYNYGTFDDSDPLFYVNFIRGKMLYYLSYTDYRSFIYSYQLDGQSVLEQTLNLSCQEKNMIYSILEKQVHSQNKYYYYDFIKNNCTTKLVDILLLVKGEEFSKALNTVNQQKRGTIRNLINNCLEKNSYPIFGINILLGKDADTLCTRGTALFLPDSLKGRLENTIVDGQKMVNRTEMLLPQQEDRLRTSSDFKTSTTLFLLSLSLFVLAIMLNLPLFCNNQWLSLLNLIIKQFICVVISIVGVALIYISFFSSIGLLKYNSNLLWCHPFYLLLVFNISRRSISWIFIVAILIFTLLNLNNDDLTMMVPVLTLILAFLFNYMVVKQKKLNMNLPN